MMHQPVKKVTLFKPSSRETNYLPANALCERTRQQVGKGLGIVYETRTELCTAVDIVW